MGERRCGKTNHLSNYTGLPRFTNSGQEPTYLTNHSLSCPLRTRHGTEGAGRLCYLWSVGGSEIRWRFRQVLEEV